jgi:hypothetical protein
MQFQLYSRGASPPSNNPARLLSRHNNLPADASALRLELIDLRNRYDSLMEAKEKAAAMYKKDYKKWRDYKRQMYDGAMRSQKQNGHKAVTPSKEQKGHESPGVVISGKDVTKFPCT